MRRLFASIFILAIAVCGDVFASGLEVWNSKEGLERLQSSQFKSDFYQLVNFYQPQANPLFCGPASGVIVLNALEHGKIASQKEIEVKRPEAMGGGVVEFKSYSQLSFLNDKTDKIKKREIINLKAPKTVIDGKEVYDPGLTIGEFSSILSKVYKLKTKLTYIEKNDKESTNKFRDLLKKYLNEDKKFVLANYDGKVLGSNTGGHISPLVAYDEKSDSVLVLDVALHKEMWYWASVDDMFKAMNTKDGDLYRGYLIVGK